MNEALQRFLLEWGPLGLLAGLYAWREIADRADRKERVAADRELAKAMVANAEASRSLKEWVQDAMRRIGP